MNQEPRKNLAFLLSADDNNDDLEALGLNIPLEQFQSMKLTKKLLQQIQDPLALVSGSLPDWCDNLPKTCPILFPSSARFSYFQVSLFRGCYQ